MTSGSTRGTSGEDFPRRSLWQRFHHRLHRNKPVLITTARTTRAQDRKKREWWYGFLQFLRVPLTLACVGMYLAWDWVLVPVVLAAITFPLPWIAVMIANMEGTPTDKRQPRVYKPAVARQAERSVFRDIEAAEQQPNHSNALSPRIIDADAANSHNTNTRNYNAYDHDDHYGE
ncbi:DUF3099 domain-containing protein [Corynebacterium propinquum]|uniref:DUF3099 domain-containing protein n=1 Tax=Corynebacterium propinquum TaxID=43769 RepID=UPI00069E1F70|nr:DUF3099 domain-containing protein [Corynebacterium propinquum]